jgi:hypothetical protein
MTSWHALDSSSSYIARPKSWIMMAIYSRGAVVVRMATEMGWVCHVWCLVIMSWAVSSMVPRWSSQLWWCSMRMAVMMRRRNWSAVGSREQNGSVKVVMCIRPRTFSINSRRSGSSFTNERTSRISVAAWAREFLVAD